jgi:hypothetical protein
MIYKTNLMKQALNDLKHLFDYKITTKKQDFLSYVRSLKPVLHEFHELINKYDGEVRMPYIKKEIQIVYVLRYFHAYWYQLYSALEAVSETIEGSKTLKIGLFCAGPAPELIGITRFLEEHDYDFNSVEIHFFDEVSQWDFARETFLFSNGKRELLKKNLKMNFFNHTINLTDLNDLNDLNISSDFDVISFQNCLNEFSESSNKDSQRNFLKVLDYLSPNCHAIFSDKKTSNTKLGFEMIKNFSSANNYQVIFDDYIEFDAKKNSPTPEILLGGNFYKYPIYSLPGHAALRWNKFRTVVLQKPLKKKVKEYVNQIHPERGDKIVHSYYGIGIVRSTIKSFNSATFREDIIKIGVEFQEHGSVTIDFPSPDVKEIFKV